ncbi:MAG: DNA repair exonuclease [Opitutae bacterium]|nr:DNA repair exonuclease [Opitutae bacterium]
MPLKILAVGDMHLGRRPSRLPEELSKESKSLGPNRAWERIVSAAIEGEVNAVVLAGDVVNTDDDFYEAYRNLKKGVNKLTTAGIQVLGVAGNHDAKVLPRLVESLPEFKLLGEGGKWESAQLEGEGQSVTLWGWSFPSRTVKESPLAGASFNTNPGINLGLLHCDRGQTTSHYAPVSNEELNNAGLDGWLLGHIHKPDKLEAPNPSGYLGSITGMDPGEPGPHGPWLLTIETGQIKSVEQWVLAPLRWESIDIDIEGIEEPKDARKRVLDELADLDAEKIEPSKKPPSALGLRINLTGRSRFGSAAVALLEGNDIIETGLADTDFFVERITSLTRPEMDLKEMAKLNDPSGLLAKQLLLLDLPTDDPSLQALLENTRATVNTRGDAAKNRWKEVKQEAPTDEFLIDLLRRTGFPLLEKMLAPTKDTA